MHTSTDTATETIPMHIRALLGGNVEVLRLAPGGVLLIEYAQPKNQSKKDALDIVGKEFARLCTTVFSRYCTLIIHSDSTSLRPTVGLKNGPYALVTCGDMQLKLELYSYFVCTAYLRPYLYVTTNDCPATLSQLKPRWQKIVREQMFAGKVASDIIRDNEVLAVYSIHNAQDNEADCFSVVINHSLRKIIVAFRGSLTATDWISNMKMGKAFFPIGPPSHEANNSNSNNSSNSTFFNSIKRQEELPQVHGGFLRGYVAGAGKLFEHLASAMTRYTDYGVVFTGYSRGAAHATLAAVHFYQLYPKKSPMVEVITYGSPRVGNPAFTRYYNSCGFGATHRVVFNNDAIARAPPRIQEFMHAGDEYRVLPDKRIIRYSQVGTNAENKLGINGTRFDHLKVEDHGGYWAIALKRHNPPNLLAKVEAGDHYI